MKGKYRAEAGLSVYTATTIFPIEKLKEMTTKNNVDSHIYAILAIDEYYLNLEKTTKTADAIHFVVRRIGEKGPEDISLSPFRCSPDVDHTAIEIVSKYPYNQFSLLVKDESYLKNHPKFRDLPIALIANNLTDFLRTEPDTRQKFEVLYVGQAYGTDGTRTSLDRLADHTTLQTILSEKGIYYPNKHIYIMVMEVFERMVMLFDGVTKSVTKNDAETTQHIKDVISDLPHEKQVVNITEAALIYHFNPPYNERLKNNFPNLKAKGYRQYFDLDYNSISVELNLDFDSGRSIELYTDKASVRSSFDFIRYPLHNEKDRKNMFEIFKDPPTS